ncbi:MAG: NAD(P)/FAD-dependent oxidoreductase [Planctomycetota bacterium]
MRRDHDVIVVGAGPAGAHLALRLARAGWSVALLDRKRFPRPKPCGEFLGPQCLTLLEEVGLREPLLALGAQHIRGLDLAGYGCRVAGGFRPIGRNVTAYDHGLGIRREVLDEAALRAAEHAPGVRIYEGYAVEELCREGDGRVAGVRGADPAAEPFELRAPLTVGADGLRSRIARNLEVWEPIPWLDRFALSTRVGKGALGEHAEVHFFPGGYLAVAPVDQGWATLNLLVERRAVPPGRTGLFEFLAAHLQRAPALAAVLAPLDPAQPILTCGPLACRTRTRTFDGAALVGDACGFVDPVTGEGMFLAMRGAALLAATLDAALHARRADRAILLPYERARRREFAHRRTLDLALQRGLRHPPLVAGVLRLLAARPGLMDLLLGMTGSAVPPRELLRPSVWRDLLHSPRPELEGV